MDQHISILQHKYYNIGATKTQGAFINSSGLNVNNTLNVSGTIILNNTATLTSSLNVSGITTQIIL